MAGAQDGGINVEGRSSLNADKAKSLLAGEVTCALCCGESVYTSTKRGVAPMVQFIDEAIDLRGYSAADKVVGKAAAMLFVIAGVTDVYAHVMSRGAIEILRAHGVSYHCKIVADRIINRKGTDICPMEKAVEHISSPQEGYKAIKATLIYLSGNSQRP